MAYALLAWVGVMVLGLAVGLLILLVIAWVAFVLSSFILYVLTVDGVGIIDGLLWKCYAVVVCIDIQSGLSV